MVRDLHDQVDVHGEHAMTRLPLFTPPEPCTHYDHPTYQKRPGFDSCANCEQLRLDESIRRADAALKRLEKREHSA